MPGCSQYAQLICARTDSRAAQQHPDRACISDAEQDHHRLAAKCAELPWLKVASDGAVRVVVRKLVSVVSLLLLLL